MHISFALQILFRAHYFHKTEENDELEQVEAANESDVTE